MFILSCAHPIVADANTLNNFLLQLLFTLAMFNNFGARRTF